MFVLFEQIDNQRQYQNSVKLSIVDTQSRHTTVVIGSYSTAAEVRSFELHSCFPTMPLFIPYREMSFGMSGVGVRVARGCNKSGD